MSRNKTLYICSACAAESSKWLGQCAACSAWNTLVESVADAPRVHRAGALVAPSAVARLASIRPAEHPRFTTGIDEFDRVLGGGLVAGQVTLIGGDPGIGKSTLLLQSLAAIGLSRKTVYVSGEESAEQVALRAQRLAVDAGDLVLLAEIQLERIAATLASEQPEVAVVDSIQTLYSEALSSAPGSVAQVRECAAQLTRLAKQSGIALFFIGHVTKEGAIAGPRVLEHMVDTVLYFEGETQSSFRLLRAFKNRFGPASELGVFAMTDRGLRGVENPSAIFLSEHREDVPGSCVLVTNEGTRPLAVEIQALVDESRSQSPRRLCLGLDANRLSMLLAVMHRHAGLACGAQDVFTNAVGGVRISEPAADLAVILAICSSLIGQPLPAKTVVFGEVGLAGEVRPAPRGQDRLREAARLGFRQAVVPRGNLSRQKIPGIEVIGVERVTDALAAGGLRADRGPER
jgi:DNA repair protein RadA/Sms